MAAEKFDTYYVTAEYTDQTGVKRFDEFIVKSYADFGRAQHWIKERLYPVLPSNFFDWRIINLNLFPHYKVTSTSIENTVCK